MKRSFPVLCLMFSVVICLSNFVLTSKSEAGPIRDLFDRLRPAAVIRGACGSGARTAAARPSCYVDANGNRVCPTR